MEQIKELVLKYHNPPNWDNSRVAITAGSQDGFSRTLEMILSPGDYVVVEEPSFCGAFSVVSMNQGRLKTDIKGSFKNPKQPHENHTLETSFFKINFGLNNIFVQKLKNVLEALYFEKQTFFS